MWRPPELLGRLAWRRRRRPQSIWLRRAWRRRRRRPERCARHRWAGAVGNREGTRSLADAVHLGLLGGGGATPMARQYFAEVAKGGNLPLTRSEMACLTMNQRSRKD